MTALRAAPRPVGLKDLAEIGKIGEAEERAAVVRALAAGEAKNATAARKAWMRQMHGAPAEVTDKVDKAHRELLALWGRAPASARRRFVRDAADQIRAILDDLEGGMNA